MENNNIFSAQKQALNQSPLEDLVRQGARQMLQAALENEVAEYLEKHSGKKTPENKQAVVRNGHLPEREIVTGLGPISIQQPRVKDRLKQERFCSSILPPYMRRTPSLDALIPALYLRGVSTGDFGPALEAILGPNAPGLSATNIVRLKEGWQKDCQEWSKRDLNQKEYVYWWADGIYFNVRLEDERLCILILMGALPNGSKELIAIVDGYRESKESWLELLRDLKSRGLHNGPKLAVGDGSLGFWAALPEIYPTVQKQRCWVHKTANLLDKFPKSLQGQAKEKIHEMYLSPTREAALKAYETFLSSYEAKYPKACECLKKDKETLFSFYDFPAWHWKHLRTTNPIESTFATVRLRTKKTKGCGSRTATLSMVYQLTRAAEKCWRKLDGADLIPKVLKGILFVDGEEKTIQTSSQAA
jgi:putative transposase